jgi:hypothetical protein
MKSTSTLSALLKVLVAALLCIAPLASGASDYKPDPPAELRSDSGSNTPQCSLKKLSAETDCAITGIDQVTETSDSTQTGEGDYIQDLEQIDITSALLEDLIKIDPDQYVENL